MSNHAFRLDHHNLPATSIETETNRAHYGRLRAHTLSPQRCCATRVRPIPTGRCKPRFGDRQHNAGMPGGDKGSSVISSIHTLRAPKGTKRFSSGSRTTRAGSYTPSYAPTTQPHFSTTTYGSCSRAVCSLVSVNLKSDLDV